MYTWHRTYSVNGKRVYPRGILMHAHLGIGNHQGVKESYHFEVCSAGIERTLKKPSDFEAFLGSAILVKLYRPRNGLKEIPCVLKGYEDGKITVEAGKETITFEKSEVALVRLRAEF